MTTIKRRQLKKNHSKAVSTYNLHYSETAITSPVRKETWG